MSTVVLRPNATTLDVSVTATGGAATNHGNTSDNSDASYIIGTQNLSYTRLEVGTTTLAADERVKSARIDIRNAASAGGDNQTTQVRFRDPVSGKTGGAHVVTRGFTTITTFQGPETTSYPGNLSWLQVRLDRLQLEAWFYVSDGGAFQRIHELYVNLTTNHQPQVAALPTVTGTGTTRPTVTWSYSDTEGDLQVAYQVKAFSAAQYGIAGFNPDTSPYTWSSGTRLGDIEFQQVETDLANGTTYKLYVRAGQAWSGPEGQYWYSDWEPSNSFVVATTPPPTPTVTVTQDLALPGYRNIIEVLAPVNLLADVEGTFEGSLGNWITDSNCAIVVDTVNPKSGTSDLKMTSSAAGTMTARSGSFSNSHPVTPGQTYTALASFRTAVSARSCNVGIKWYNTAGGTVSTVFGSNVTDGSGGYTSATFTGAAPATAIAAHVVVQVQSTGAGAEVHRVDEVSLHSGSTTTFTPGGWQSTAEVVVERLDKVEPTRGNPVNWAHPQIASAGGYTLDTVGFSARQSSLLQSVPIDGPHPAGITYAGSRMIYWRPLVGAANMLDIGMPDPDVPGDDTPPYLTAAVPGQSMTFSAYCRGSSAVNARVRAYAVDATNTLVGSITNGSTVALPTGATTWTRYTVTATVPAGACFIRAALELTSASQDVDVFVTGMQWEQAAAATALTAGRGELVSSAVPGSVTWREVRPLDSTVVPSPGETYTVIDSEACPGRPVLYRARLFVPDPVLIASANSAVTAVYMTPAARTIVKDPYRPEWSLIVATGRGDQGQVSEDAAVFHPLGRDADPLKWRTWRSGRDPQWEFSVLSAHELYLIEQLLGSSRHLLVQWASGGQEYALVTGYQVTRVVMNGLHRVSVSALAGKAP